MQLYGILRRNGWATPQDLQVAGRALAPRVGDLEVLRGGPAVATEDAVELHVDAPYRRSSVRSAPRVVV